MQPEMFSCCEEQPSWIFIYENNVIFSICDIHFTSIAHRCFVKDILDYNTGKRHSPDQIFTDTAPLVEAI